MFNTGEKGAFNTIQEDESSQHHNDIKGERTKNNIDSEALETASQSVNVGVQCILPIESRSSTEPQFNIIDCVIRRHLVRKVYTLLIAQHVFYIVVMELFLYFIDASLSVNLFKIICVVLLFIYVLIYILGDARRKSPMNYAVLAFITVLHAGVEGAYATVIGSQMALIQPVAQILQLLVLIAYTKQNRFKFTHLRGLLLLFLIFVIYMCAVVFLGPPSMCLPYGHAFLQVWYVLYDTQLMLSGYHKYQLKPEEHVFAAANIYADFSKMLLVLFRIVFLNGFIAFYRFIKKCCRAEVC